MFISVISSEIFFFFINTEFFLKLIKYLLQLIGDKNKKDISSNLISLAKFGTRPDNWGTKWESNSLAKFW